MSQFEEGLREARRRQVRFYVGGLVGLVLIGLAVIGVLVSTSGTVVKITPDEAVDGGRVELVEGLGLAVGMTVYSLGGAPVVAVRSEGFRDVVHEVVAAELGRTVEIRLQPLPGRLDAATGRDLPGTRWSLDGQPVAIATSIDLERPAGNYKLAANHLHFQPVELELELERGKTAEVRLDLVPVAGRLTIASAPSGAEVFLNDLSVGATPLEMTVEGGVYRIQVTAPDRVAIDDEVKVTNIAPQVERRYILKPVSATLKLSVSPAGGELLVNGRKVANSGEVELAANQDHTVTYVLEGYKAKSQTVRLKALEHKSLALELQPELGLVDIRTTPGAEIFIDGEKVGTGSAELQLLAVPHKIELRKKAYRTIRKTITPSDQRTLVIREELIGETAARLAESPQSYTNSVGISLSLFKPTPFVMGAPRSQKGQRANEFEKRVNLRKPFYAARHEVTNGQFGQFKSGRWGASKAPVTGISWVAAAEFTNWLSVQERLTPFYRISNGRLVGVSTSSDGYRLLSEAEWEWLARLAGRPKQTIFTWGDTGTVPKKAGNIADESANGITKFYVPKYNDGFAGLAPVGSFPAESSGLFDLTGNVSEWVHDFYSLQPPSRNQVETDPLGPRSGGTHVVKGSSWKSGTRTKLRASYREGSTNGKEDIGFRIGRYLHAAQGSNAR